MSRLGKIVPQETKRVGLAIAEQQQELLNGDKEVYQEFTNNIPLIRLHLNTFDDDFRRTRGRLQDALKLLEKYIKRDFHVPGKRKGIKFDVEQQLFFVKHSELIVRGVIARVVVPDKFRDYVDDLDLEFYSTITRKLSVQSTAPPSKEVMKLAVNQIDESFRNLQLDNGQDDIFNFENEGTSESGDQNDGSKEEDPVDIIRGRLLHMNVDESCREVLVSRSAHLVDLARQFDRALQVTRSASPPRPSWGDVKEEDVKQEQLEQSETQLATATAVNEKKEDCDDVETTGGKKVRFAVINRCNEGAYESVNELVVFDHVSTNYRVDLGYHIAMRYDGDRCDIGQLMKDHSQSKPVVRMSTTIKEENKKDMFIKRCVLRDLRTDYYPTSKTIRTPIHLDLQPIDGSNRFKEFEAQEYLMQCSLLMSRFSSNWAGMKPPEVAQTSNLNEHESNVFGVLLLSDSLFECIEPGFLLNGAVISLVPPLTLDDFLTILSKTRYDNLFVREIVVSFGHDILTYTDKVTDKTIEDAVRATFEAVDRLEALFKKRRDEFLSLDPKFALILDISTEVTKVKECPLPNFKVLTIPEYGDRAQAFAKYNAAIRQITPFMKNCVLVDWAIYRFECDRAFMEQEDQGYDSHKMHVEARFRHLAKMLYVECYLLHYRKNMERFPYNRSALTIDQMI